MDAFIKLLDLMASMQARLEALEKKRELSSKEKEMLAYVKEKQKEGKAIRELAKNL